MKILIVEDQEMPLLVLEDAVNKVMPKYFPNFSCDTAKWYTQAEEKIKGNKYDLVLLDHRMPYQQTDCEEGSKKYSDLLDQIGYGLVKLIKENNPKTKVIGTSSLSASEICKYNPAPDYVLSKFNAEQDLRNIIENFIDKK